MENIVKCADCIWCTEAHKLVKSDLIVDHRYCSYCYDNSWGPYNFEVSADDFCSRGEARKEQSDV